MTPRVQALPGKNNNTHDVRLFNGVEEVGLLLVEDNRLQEIPISEGAREYQREQASWFSGLGRLRFKDDPNGYWDSYAMWTMTEGKLFPMPMWRYAKGYRSADFSFHGDTDYQKVDTYISISFTASASYNADKVLLWLDWSGSPSALTYQLRSDSGGDPDANLKTGTLAVGSATRYGPTELDWSGTQALTSGTTYHLVIYHAGGANDYWKVGVDADGAGSKTSADGSSSWTAAAYSLYYRVVDADTKRQWMGFDFKGAKYAVSVKDNGANSTLYINGDRGKASAGTSTTLTDSASGITAGWTNDQWIGAWIRIIAGTGAGQVREITDNDSTSVTVATWDVTPSTDSEYVIYSTPIWQSISITLGAVTSRPLVVGDVVYLPQGATAIRKLALDYTTASRHKESADSTNTADRLEKFYNKDNETEIWASDDDGSQIKYSAEKTYATTLSFSDWKDVGGTPVITNLLAGEDKMYVFKEDGYYTVSPSRTILPGWERTDSIDPNNGKAAMWFNNELWFSWSNSLQRIIKNTDDISDMLLYRSGTQGLIRPGIPVGVTFGIGWRFFAIDGGSSKVSSVVVFNGYGWMEVFRGWKTGARIRNVFWQNCPGTRPRLWIDVDGDLVYIEFPLFAANPRRDTSLSYQHYSELETSTFTAGDDTLYKLVASVRLNLEEASSTVYVDYQKDDDVGTSTWYEIGLAKNIQRNEFILNLGNVQQYRLRLRVYTTTATDPPVINSYMSRGHVVSPKKYMWVSSFRVDQNQITRRGSPDFSPDYIYDYLMDAAERASALQMRSVISTMDDKSVTVSFPVKHQNWSQVLNGKTQWGGYIDVQFRET